MTWFELKEHRGWVASPYAIYRDTQGFSLWLNDKQSHGILGRNYQTLKAAQDAAEQHKANVRSPN